MSYANTLLGWHDFYMITGTGAASLVGLLFVGLSLHLRMVVSRPDVRALARVTLSNFILTLVLALFMVIPEHTPSDTGWELIGLGAISVVYIAPSLFAGVRSRRRTIRPRMLILRFGLSMLAFAGLIVSGIVLETGDYRDALAWLVGVTVVVLVVSLRNTWDLLVSVAAATTDSRDAAS
jgi:hypothetical protein